MARDNAGIDVLHSGGDRSSLVDALRTTAQSLRYNFAGYTQEVRYTDRVLRFPSLFAKDALAVSPVSLEPPNTALLYATATGDPGDFGYFPLAAVRWLTPPRDIAALVTRAGPHEFAAELYHFGPKGRSMSAGLYLLEPGRYTVEVIEAGSDAPGGLTTPLEASGRRTRVQFLLPARKLCVMRVRPAADRPAE